jgi:hypothetical protein
LALVCAALAVEPVQAEPLDGAAEGYRPLMAEEIDCALTGG